jgi:hypothetical protein
MAQMMDAQEQEVPLCYYIRRSDGLYWLLERAPGDSECTESWVENPDDANAYTDRQVTEWYVTDLRRQGHDVEVVGGEIGDAAPTDACDATFGDADEMDVQDALTWVNECANQLEWHSAWPASGRKLRDAADILRTALLATKPPTLPVAEVPYERPLTIGEMVTKICHDLTADEEAL